MTARSFTMAGKDVLKSLFVGLIGQQLLLCAFKYTSAHIDILQKEDIQQITVYSLLRQSHM